MTTTTRCERCGSADASMVTASADPNGSGPARAPDSEIRYCGACARMLSSGSTERYGRRAGDRSAHAAWSEIEQLIEQLETALRHHPSLRESILDVARYVPRYAEQHGRRVGESMPDEIAERLTRLSVNVVR